MLSAAFTGRSTGVTAAYTDIKFLSMILAYCAGRGGVQAGLSTTKLARVPLSWLQSVAASPSKATEHVKTPPELKTN
jgi:hypothetical protein